MHYESYVLVPISEVSTSLEARLYVAEELSDDPSFMGEGGRFSAPICDWFVIGGRWSGTLCPKSLDDEFWNQVDQLLGPAKDPLGITDSLVEEHRKKLDSIWKELGGKYQSPLTRDRYRELGEEDDACPLHDWLAQELNVYLHDTERYDIADCYINRRGGGLKPIVICLGHESLYDLKDFNEVIGKYWVVIIDYHN